MAGCDTDAAAVVVIALCAAAAAETDAVGVVGTVA